jgi:site-specific recombinase XerD
MVERYVVKLLASLPSLQKKRVSPHNIRHTTATHLLWADVDINTIRAWLGHVSIDTTNIYAETDLATKQQALARLAHAGSKLTPGGWSKRPDLMAFLRSL